MKRYINTSLPALIPALMIAGCSEMHHNDQPNQNPDETVAVCFATPTVTVQGIHQENNTSRSTLKRTFNEGDQFRVIGYCVPYTLGSTTPDWNAASSSWNVKSKYAHADVFPTTDGTTLVTIKADGTTYANIQPWKTQTGYADNNFLYTFIACHPTDNFTISPTNAATMGAPQFIFTMPLSGNALTTQLNHENVPDALLAARFDHKRSDGKVNLSFYHILTGLRFRINNYTDRNLTITGMTLSGRFYRSATFDFSSENVKQHTPSLASNNYQGVFTLAGNNGAVTTVPGNGSKLIGQSETNPDGTTILLLPNPDADPSTADANTLYSLGDNKDITIHYRYEGDNTDKTSLIKDFHLSYTPAQSTRYTANLNFVGDKFVLIFMADNNEQWENGSDNNIDIN